MCQVPGPSNVKLVEREDPSQREQLKRDFAALEKIKFTKLPIDKVGFNQFHLIGAV